jgi:5-hydroxyisourate hydrolase
MSVSTHVLDASLGVPATGVAVILSRLGTDNWERLESGVTDADGRHQFGAPTPAGTYRLVFATGRYFAGRATATFYPEITVTFSVTEGHFHVPLLLSPFGYSTYRGT